MFETGSRSIVDVLAEHVGHVTQIRNVGEYQGDEIVTVGVRVVCVTCGETVLRQDYPEPIPLEVNEVVGGSWEESTTPTPEPWDTQSTGCVNDTGWDTSDREWTT